MSDYPRMVTIGILALMIICALLAYVLGATVERFRRMRREDEAWRDGFDVGSAVDEKTRKMQAREKMQARARFGL